MSAAITQEQAYRAMFLFLEKYYATTGADDVGALLGSMQILEDGSPADSAMKAEWSECVNAILEIRN